jgi:hypothetical protein
MISKPLIQIDCGGRFVADVERSDLSIQVASDLGLDILEPPKIPGPSQGTKRW